MDILELSVLGRILERLLVVAAAIMSLWIGGRLFAVTASKTDHVAELSYKDFLVRLQKVGPGIFFAAFGALILLFAINRPLEIGNGAMIGTADGVPGTLEINYMSGNDNTELERWIAAITTTREIASTPAEQEIVLPDRELLADSSQVLLEVRSVLLALRFSEAEVATWARWKEEYQHNPITVPEDIRETVKSVNEVASRSFIEYTE